MNMNFIHLFIVLFTICLITTESQTETTELRSRITIFDIIFNDWISISIASVGIIADYFLRRIPYPNDRNSSRLFHHMDIDGDHKVDIREFQSYLIQLFHANDVVSFEFGRKVSPPEVAKQFSLWEPKTRNMRWNCLMDYFDDDKDLAIDYDEFKALKANKFDAFNCLLCIRYRNHCMDFRELYVVKV